MENSNKAPSCTITSSGCLMIIVVIILLCICDRLNKLIEKDKPTVITPIENTK